MLRHVRSRLPGVRLLLAIALSILTLLAACGGDGNSEDAAPGPGASDTAPKIEDPGPIHVHGLGINPQDGALFIATHTGLFRAPKGEMTAKRVADRYQDTMGFTVVGPDRFLGSGHPDAREGLPPFLGLIRSNDAGNTWEEVSLMGKVDFHVLEAAGNQVYGFGSDYDTQAQQLLVSEDGGRTWKKHATPGPLFSLAISPDDARHVVATTEDGLYTSVDAGESWRALDAEPGLVAWLNSGTLALVDGDGGTLASQDSGRSFEPRGEIGGEPAAFDSAGDELYAALHDGTVKRSTDAGRSWSVRSRPKATVTE
jgi:hypothetical protein